MNNQISNYENKNLNNKNSDENLVLVPLIEMFKTFFVSFWLFLLQFIFRSEFQLFILLCSKD